MNAAVLPVSCCDINASVRADIKPVPGVSAYSAQAAELRDFPRRTVSSDAQLLANGCSRVSDLIDRALQFVPGDPESLEPILDLEVLAHVDLAAIRLISLGEVIHRSASPGPRWKRGEGRSVPMMRTFARGRVPA